MGFSGTNGQIISVLCVDDEPPLLNITKKMLERSGNLAVSTAISAAEAIDLLSKASYDAIVSDYLMPEMDGIAFLKHLRAAGDETPFIIFTGKGREEVAIEALNSGADFYLQKGGDPKAQYAELANKITYAVGKRRAERALAESEERYRSVSTVISDIAFSCIRPDAGVYRIDWMTGAVERTTGYTSEEVIAMGCWRTIVHPGDLDTFDANIISLLPGETADCQLRIITRDGGIRWLAVSTRAVRDTGERTRIYGGCRDITGAKIASDELRISHDRLDGAMEAGDIAWWEMDCTTGAVTFSARKAAMLGYPPETFSHYTDFTALLHPDDHERAMQAMRDHLDGRASRYEVEYRIRAADGAYRWFSDTGGVTERDSAGNPVKVTGLVGNITGRKLAAAALAESEERYRIITENMTETISILDLSLRFTYVSPSITALRGYSVEEAMAQSLEEVLTPECIPIADQAFEAAMQQEASGNPVQAVTLDLEEYRKDGSTIWVNNTMTFLRDPAGTATAILIVSRDITQQRKAEAALQESELFNRTLVQNLPDYILVYGMNGRIIHITPPAAAAFGYEVDEMVRSNLASFVAEECRGEMVRKLSGRIQGNTIPPYEVVFVSRAGERITVLVRGVQISYHNTPAILLVLTDITERKQAEAALRKSEEKYRLIADNTADNIWIFDLDFRLRYVSPSVQKIKGFTVEESLAQSVQEMLTPASYAALMQRFGEEMALEATGTADPDRKVSIETEEYCRDGSTIQVENSVTLLRDEQGRPVGMLGVSRDVTDRKRALAALRESEEKYRNLVENLSEIIYVLDDKARVTYVSPNIESISGYTPTEVIGKRFIDFVHPDDREERPGQFQRVLAGHAEPTEYRFIARDGRVVWVRTAARPVIREGRVTGIQGVLADITDRKQAEETLRIADRKLRILSGITRHDILNQVMALQGFLGLAADAGGGPEQAAYLDHAGAAAATILRHSEFTREYEEIGLKTPVWLPLPYLLGMISDKRLPLRNDCGILSLYADPMLEKVFANLMENTLRHGTGATEVHLSCEESGGALRLIWEDDGSGIPADQKERIFERGIGRNTGFGLFLSREILAITGITITENGEPGKGARFEILVPHGAWRRDRPGGAGHGEGA